MIWFNSKAIWKWPVWDHDHAMIWKSFSSDLPFVRGIHLSPVAFGVLFSLPKQTSDKTVDLPIILDPNRLILHNYKVLIHNVVEQSSHCMQIITLFWSKDAVWCLIWLNNKKCWYMEHGLPHIRHSIIKIQGISSNIQITPRVSTHWGRMTHGFANKIRHIWLI